MILPTVSEDTAGIALRGVVAEAIVRYRAVGGIDFGKPCHGLLVKGAVNDPSQCANAGFEENDTSSRLEHAAKFAKRRLWVFQMVKHVEEYQVRDTLVSKAQSVSILYLVDPWIGKHVSADTLWDMLLKVANSRSQLHDQPLLRAIYLCADQRIEIIVDGLQYRLILPIRQVLVNLFVMAIEVFHTSHSNELNLPCGEGAHFNQQPAMLEAADLRGSVFAVLVSNDDLRHLQV